MLFVQIGRRDDGRQIAHATVVNEEGGGWRRRKWERWMGDIGMLIITCLFVYAMLQSWAKVRQRSTWTNTLINLLHYSLLIKTCLSMVVALDLAFILYWNGDYLLIMKCILQSRVKRWRWWKGRTYSLEGGREREHSLHYRTLHWKKCERNDEHGWAKEYPTSSPRLYIWEMMGAIHLGKCMRILSNWILEFFRPKIAQPTVNTHDDRTQWDITLIPLVKWYSIRSAMVTV